MDGGDNIVEAQWRSVSGIMQKVCKNVTDTRLTDLFGSVCFYSKIN